MSRSTEVQEIMSIKEGKTRRKNKTKDPRLKYGSLQVDPVSGRCVCKICGKSLKALQYFKRHVCIAKDKDKKMVMDVGMSCCCHLCGKLFSTLSSLKLHQMKHDLRVDSEMCDSCGRHFLNKVSLNRHKLLTHWQPAPLRCHCLMCGFSSTSFQCLKNHLKHHLGYGCLVCDRGFQWKGCLNDHLRVAHNIFYSCSFKTCGKQKSLVNGHNTTEHTGDEPHSCSKSPKELLIANSLYGRMKSQLHVKKQKKQYSCHLCNNRLFIDKTCLAVHMASAHSDEKSYICDVCGKGFKLKNGLRAHCQTHSDERPYECDLCDGAFKFKKDLRKHQERHKSSKDYFCSICEKRFMTKNDVYLHQKVHDPSRHHRIYKPGKFKVCGGELLTARTRRNKLSLKEQEHISFDSEINGNRSNRSREQESQTNSDQIFPGVPNSLLHPSVANEAFSKQPLKYENFFEASGDSNEFPSINAIQRASGDSNEFPCINAVQRASGDSNEFPSINAIQGASGDSNEFPSINAIQRASAVESPTDKYLSSSSDSTKDSDAVPSVHKFESREGWNSMELLEDYDWLDVSSLNSPAGEDPLCAAYDQNSRSGFTCTAVQDSVRLLHIEDNQSLTSNFQELPDFASQVVIENVMDGLKQEEKECDTVYDSDVDLESLNEYLNKELNNSQSLTEIKMDDFSSSLHSAEYEQSPCAEDVQESSTSLADSDVEGESSLNKQDSYFGTVNKNKIENSDQGKFDSMLTPRSDELGSFGGVHVEIESKLEVILKIIDFARADTASVQGGHGKEKQHLIDFQMTSCDMFNDNSDILEENDTLDARRLTCCSPENENSQNAMTCPMDEPSSDCSHMIEREIKNQKHVDKETKDQEDADKEESGRYEMFQTPEKHRNRYRVLEVATEHDEFVHGIMRPKKQRKMAGPGFECPACEVTLSTRNGWKRHQQFCKTRSTDGHKKFSCEDCGRRYTTLSNLHSHQLACHAGDSNNFVCHLCGHICSDRQNLGRHLVWHSSARPFKCDMCQRCFKTREAVKAHLNRHLPSKMLYGCDRCNMFYNHFNSLQSHKQTHLPVAPIFTCGICHKQLSDKSNLTAHTRRHQEPRKYSCHICFKQLSSVHSLQSHQGRACLKYQFKMLKTREKTVS